MEIPELKSTVMEIKTLDEFSRELPKERIREFKD